MLCVYNVCCPFLCGIRDNISRILLLQHACTHIAVYYYYYRLPKNTNRQTFRSEFKVLKYFYFYFLIFATCNRRVGPDNFCFFFPQAQISHHNLSKKYNNKLRISLWPMYVPFGYFPHARTTLRNMRCVSVYVCVIVPCVIVVL